MGSWLAALHVEYCCLMNIVVTTNARLIGEWPEDWQPSQYHSALHARDMMVRFNFYDFTHPTRVDIMFCIVLNTILLTMHCLSDIGTTTEGHHCCLEALTSEPQVSNKKLRFAGLSRADSGASGQAAKIACGKSGPSAGRQSCHELQPGHGCRPGHCHHPLLRSTSSV